MRREEESKDTAKHQFAFDPGRRRRRGRKCRVAADDDVQLIHNWELNVLT